MKIELRIYNPPAEPRADRQAALEAAAPDVWALGPQVFVPHDATPEPPAKDNVSPPMSAAGLFPTPLRDRLRNRLVNEILMRADAGNVSPKDVEALVNEVAGERPLLEWLRDGGWEKLVKLIVELLKLAA